jgi:hypothetical protein
MGTDTRADDAADGQWMTYAELGRARGISKESALKLALRRKWRKQDDNHGHVRVYVPIDWVSSRDMGADNRADAGADISHVISGLEAAITTLRDQITTANTRADQAEARAERAEQAREAERARTDVSRDQVDDLHVQLVQLRTGAETRAAELRTALDTAEARAAAMDRTEAARAAWSRWRRLREAWRGE